MKISKHYFIIINPVYSWLEYGLRGGEEGFSIAQIITQTIRLPDMLLRALG